jgi:hypothetical protein
MTFDVRRIQAEIQKSALYVPIPIEIAVATISDTQRAAGKRPVPDATWGEIVAKNAPNQLEQLAVLAWMLHATSLRADTIVAIGVGGHDAKRAVLAFLASIAPLTGDMIRTNAFRQEEFLRKWAAVWAAPIAGEKPEDSARRLEQLDYRKALAEFERAEAARKVEAEKRAKALREAAERDAAASSWRE